MINKVNRRERRLKKHKKIRKFIKGTDKCPRISVFRSSRNIFVQIIDDTKGNTLVSASSLEFKKENLLGGNIDAAKKLGKIIGEKALKIGLKKVVFDRSGYLYHGRIKALAEGMRKVGLIF